MTVNVTGFSPYQQFQTRKGTSFTADSTGTVTGVTIGTDLDDLLRDGGDKISGSLTPTAANGLFLTRIPLTSGRNSDGTSLGSGASGKFAVSLTAGTSGPTLTTEAANSNTKTDTVDFEQVLPRNYVAGQNITVTVNCQYTLGSGTIGTHTLTGHAYLVGVDGTHGSDLVATSAATVAATAADKTFAITGTTLSPGDRIVITAVIVVQDTGGSNITAQINSVRLS